MNGLLPYAATLRMSIKKSAYFGVSYLIGEYALRALAMLALVVLWRSLLLDGADTGVFTLSQALTYTLISSALADVLNVRTAASSWIFEGGIQGQLSRPMGVYMQNIAMTAGEWVMPLILYALPMMTAGAIIGIEIRPASGWFFVSLPLAVSLGFAVDFLFACLMIRLHQASWLVETIRRALTGVFSGSLIPFAAFPLGLGRALEFMPLGSLAGAPLAAFAGIGDARPLILAQIGWNAVLWPLAVFCFNKSRERMVSHGG